MAGEKYVFTRDELHEISRRATEMAEMKSISPSWAGTYRKLAAAADELDARWDRCEVNTDEREQAIAGCLEIRFTEHEVELPKEVER